MTDLHLKHTKVAKIDSVYDQVPDPHNCDLDKCMSRLQFI